MLLVTLKVRLHIIAKNLLVPTSKVFLLTFICLNLSRSYWLSYTDHPINQISLNINNVFTETGVLDKRECYLLGDLNINLLHDEKEIFSKKSYRTNGIDLPPSTKSYLDFCFSFSMEQLISIPIWVTSKTATLIDHVLTNSTQKVSQCSVIESTLIDHVLTNSTQKVSQCSVIESTLIDHVLTTSAQKVSQCGVIESTLIDHVLTKSTQKVSQCGVIELGNLITILYTVQGKHLRLSSVNTIIYLLGQ